jgi:3-deoxy-manno-octulosonate cytidylyltransferase (CMP-KDO synthetase)
MSARPKIIGVIPARLGSTRLPGKVLREIAGRPMLYWVYHHARRSPLLDDLVVATENLEVQQYCESQGIPATLTACHPSPTDRVHEVMTRTDGDVYANIQGDEPMLRPAHFELLLAPFLEGAAQVTTLKVAVDDRAAQDPNNVKVVTDDCGRALYFSRFPIPYRRDAQGGIQYYKHLGLYAYTRAALSLFHSLPQSSLELAEKLDQLRFLQHGVPILVAETPQDTIGVDTEADLAQVNALFASGAFPKA